MSNSDGKPAITIRSETKCVPCNISKHDLQMYEHPPLGDVDLVQLQDWCAKRITVLKLVDKISMQNYRKSSKQCAEILTKELGERDLHNFVKLLNGTGSTLSQEYSLKTYDCASHFLLKCAIACNRSKMFWFVKQEARLFKWKFSSLDKEGIETFMSINKVHHDPISMEEKEQLKEQLELSCCDDIDNTMIFKIPFTRVTELCGRRQVLVHSAMAYVPEIKLASLIVPEFKKRVNAGFRLAREIATNMTDERISNIFRVICGAFNISRFNIGPQCLSLDEVDELAETSFPLCMSTLHKILREEHHLMRGGRLQYSLFLKGIGLNLESAIKFWMDEFMIVMDEETCRKKKYMYELRHLYGQVGCQKDYRPLNCRNIIKTNISRTDCHGCPFQTMSKDVLKETLSENEFLQQDTESIINMCKENKYQDACTKYFELTQRSIVSENIDHPNMYYYLSRKILDRDPFSF